MNNSGLVKAVGVVVFLLLFLSVIIASPLNGNRKAAYGCRSCGSHANNGQQASSPTPEIKRLEGKEKEEAVSKAVNSEDFKSISSFLVNEGLEFTLEDAIALKFTRMVDKKPWNYVLVGINFTGDAELRQVTAVIVLEPYQEARAYRFDVKRNLVELLVKAVRGQIVGGKLTPTGREALPMSNMLLTQSGCPTCTFECVECVEMDYACLIKNCYQHAWCPPCCAVFFWYCCKQQQFTCCSCDPASCFVAECMECPVCYG